MKTNLFVTFLNLLEVNFTKKFSEKYFNEHPNKNNLFGISKLLTDYNIENAGIRIEDKDRNLPLLDTPFIAQVSNDLVVVERVVSEQVSYIWNEKKITTTSNEFNKIWSGVALVVEPDEYSIEPNYKENRKKELIETAQSVLLLLGLLVSIVLIYASNHSFNDWGVSLSLTVNLIGVYVSYLLVLKQMHIQSDYADKICSLFKQKDCNSVLESSASKLSGVIGWSEVGFGYFISNTIVLLFSPNLICYLVVINLFTLPYTIWSVWFQKVKVKQWCPLCLVVQALLWGIFITNLFFRYIQLPEISIASILSVGCIYLIPFLTINLLLPLLVKGHKAEQITQEMNSIKMDDDVFKSYLKKQPYSKVNKSVSNILLGNPNAETLITIFTNPHCEPCGKMHIRVENLLKETKDKFCIQYIFASFNQELESSTEFLIHSYLNNSYDEVKTIYHEWFMNGKYDKDVFFRKYNFSKKNNSEEYLKHKKWKEENKLSATPTVLINGYELPKNYKIEDLKFISEFNVNVK